MSPIYPLEKDMALHLNKLVSPLPTSVVEIGSVVLEKKTKIWKIYHDNQDKDNRINDEQWTNFSQKSSF